MRGKMKKAGNSSVENEKTDGLGAEGYVLRECELLGTEWIGNSQLRK